MKPPSSAEDLQGNSDRNVENPAEAMPPEVDESLTSSEPMPTEEAKETPSAPQPTSPPPQEMDTSPSGEPAKEKNLDSPSETMAPEVDESLSSSEPIVDSAAPTPAEPQTGSSADAGKNGE